MGFLFQPHYMPDQVVYLGGIICLGNCLKAVLIQLAEIVSIDAKIVAQVIIEFKDTASIKTLVTPDLIHKSLFRRRHQTGGFADGFKNSAHRIAGGLQHGVRKDAHRRVEIS